nr:nudix hydrolase 25 isoform X1 [Arachis hypogaea]
MEDLPQGYRPNVGVCLINSHNQIFVASRLNVPGAWQMPQGGIEDGEEPKLAAIRELQEETGIASAEIIAEVPKWLTYDFPPPVKTKVNRLWGGEWHGQAQKWCVLVCWFLMQLRDDDIEVNLATGEADPEFAEWKWASPEEVVEEAVDYKRPTYEEVMRTFKPYFQGSAISAKCKSAKW